MSGQDLTMQFYFMTRPFSPDEPQNYNESPHSQVQTSSMSIELDRQGG